MICAVLTFGPIMATDLSGVDAISEVVIDPIFEKGFKFNVLSSHNCEKYLNHAVVIYVEGKGKNGHNDCILLRVISQEKISYFSNLLFQ